MLLSFKRYSASRIPNWKTGWKKGPSIIKSFFHKLPLLNLHIRKYYLYKVQVRNLQYRELQNRRHVPPGSFLVFFLWSVSWKWGRVLLRRSWHSAGIFFYYLVEKGKGMSPLRLINQINMLINFCWSTLMEKSTGPHLRGFTQLLKSECWKISYEDDVLFRVSLNNYCLS